MDGAEEFLGDKRQHYYYLEKLFNKVSKMFLQLSRMVTDLEDVFSVLEDGCVIGKADCVYKRNRNRFDRRKALPFAMFIKDSIERCQEENPGYDIVDCVNILKTYWDDPEYRNTREMYEFMAEEREDELLQRR